MTFALSRRQHQLLLGMITQPGAFALVIRGIAIDILLAIIFVMGLIAGVDLVWSRFHWRRTCA